MVIIITLIILFTLFFLIRKHTGPAHLSMIAGLSVYALIGHQLTDLIANNLTAASIPLIENLVYVAFILVFPLILYLRSGHGGLGGILRIVEAAIFATIATALLSGPLAYFFPFDALSTQIHTYITSIEGPLITIGIAAAYLDILLGSGPD
jgi:hypothetical protein